MGKKSKVRLVISVQSYSCILDACILDLGHACTWPSPQDELTKLNKEIEDRHAAELRALVSLEPKQQQRHEAAATKEEVGAAVQSPAAKLDELSLESDASKVHPSKL